MMLTWQLLPAQQGLIRPARQAAQHSTALQQQQQQGAQQPMCHLAQHRMWCDLCSGVGKAAQYMQLVAVGMLLQNHGNRNSRGQVMQHNRTGSSSSSRNSCTHSHGLMCLLPCKPSSLT
jgi:hypothetical protein